MMQPPKRAGAVLAIALGVWANAGRAEPPAHATSSPPPAVAQPAVGDVPAPAASPAAMPRRLPPGLRHAKPSLDAAAPGQTPAPGGTVEAKERSYDAGKVDRGFEIEHVFVLRNVGKHDLKLEVDATCGCTVLDFDRLIPPGGEGKIKANIKTDHFRGPLSKSIQVTTNDPASSQFDLEIKADVKVAIDVLPAETLQLTARPGEGASGEVTLVATEGRPFTIQSLSDLSGLGVSIAPVGADGKVGPAVDAKKATPGTPLATGATAYRLALTMPPQFPIGRSAQTLTVATDHPKAATLSVYVTTWSKGEIEVSPERVFFQAPSVTSAGPHATPGAAPVSMIVKLRKAEGAPLEIAKVASSDPDVTASLTPVVPGREYDLAVAYVAKAERGIVSARVTLNTNVARQAQIVIPVFAKPQPGGRRAPAGPAALQPLPAASASGLP